MHVHTAQWHSLATGIGTRRKGSFTTASTACQWQVLAYMPTYLIRMPCNLLDHHKSTARRLCWCTRASCCCCLVANDQPCEDGGLMRVESWLAPPAAAHHQGAGLAMSQAGYKNKCA
jgi:hypothetical protein